MTDHTATAPATKGAVMRSSARYYDLLAWLLSWGHDRAWRERMAALARLAPGESVLDVGCGTGTLAVAAKRSVGASGRVTGIDASPEMIERATRKARRAGADVAFRLAVVESLPFPDASFDVVLSTLMMHHLPRATRENAAREIRRVLKPNGRVLVVDFGTLASGKRGLLAHFHRHGGLPVDKIVELLEGAELKVTDRGEVGIRDLQFALATKRPGA